MHSKLKLAFYVATLAAVKNVIAEKEKGRHLGLEKPSQNVCPTITLFFQSYPAHFPCRRKVFPDVSFKLYLQSPNNEKYT